MKYFGVFKDNTQVLTDEDETTIKLAESVKELADAQKEGEEALQKKLNLLNATNEVEKYAIQQGRELSNLEIDLLNAISARNEAMRVEKAGHKAVDEAIKLQNISKRDQLHLRRADLISLKELRQNNAAQIAMANERIRLKIDSKNTILELSETELRIGDQITFTNDAGSTVTSIVEAIISNTSLTI